MPQIFNSGPSTFTLLAAPSEWQERARWSEWNWRRGLAASIMATAAAMGVVALLYVALDAALCGIFDGVCTGTEVREHRAAAVAALLVTLAGPSMVAVLRRRPVWVVVPAVVLVFVGPWVVVTVA